MPYRYVLQIPSVHVLNCAIVSLCTHRPDDGPQYTGVYAVNNELQKARRIFEGQIVGPESFAVDKDGTPYNLAVQKRSLPCNQVTCILDWLMDV